MINGAPGWRVWAGDQVAAALQLVVVAGRIVQVLIVLNPDKLGGIDRARQLARYGRRAGWAGARR